MPVIMPVAVPTLQSGSPVNKAGLSSKEESFRDLLHSALQNVNKSQLEADATVTSFLTGEIKDVHTVMIALGEARLTMQLAVEVRNKVVESYHELSRMQI